MLVEYIRKSNYNSNKKSPRDKKCKYVASREKKGVLVALVCDDNIVRIGWSLCNKQDKFTTRGLDIAVNRAEKHSTTIPFSIQAQLRNFIKRAEKYYKDKTVEINLVQID